VPAGTSQLFPLLHLLLLTCYSCRSMLATYRLVCPSWHPNTSCAATAAAAAAAVSSPQLPEACS
jgi:hypothetical protein